MKSHFHKFGSCRDAEEASILQLVIGREGTVSSAVNEALRLTHQRVVNAQRTRALVRVVADLISHGWQFKIVGRDILATNEGANEGEDRKEYVRRVQLAQREQQLYRPSVRDFIFSMERRRLGPQGWVSIFSLIRDGAGLANRLRSLQAGESAVPAAIQPYIQVIESPNQRCEFTGLRLMDVWRYFRYTWAMPYNSVPGRSMLILIRDAKADNHPVMGIAALGSAIVQMSQRDKWIGWGSSQFLKHLEEHPSRTVAKWISRQLDEFTKDVYKTDLIRDGVFRRTELRKPTTATIEGLRQTAQKAWRLHRKFPNKKDHKEREYSDKHWSRQALLPLFRAKRSETLAKLLEARKALNDSGFTKPTVSNLRKLLMHSSGKRAVEILLRLTKAQHVGIDMLDITICGAVPPYNPILGGKLVAMLMCSPEIVHAYRKRYRNAPSIIASSMTGRSVFRRPRLVLLGTTSLYGERLNQYHRVQVPSHIAGGPTGAVRFEFLGESIGYGSSHLSKATVEELELLLAHSKNGRRVNSIFGEGVSPRLRKIRDGLSLIGLDPDPVLNHGNRRLVYGIPLAENFRQILLGLSERGKYVLPQGKAKLVTTLIAQYWGKRWLDSRLANRPEVIDFVAVNDIRVPYSHGACVQLPALPIDAPPLFA
jgi:hypothetical protein